MKTFVILSILAAPLLAAPIDYTPVGGWGSIDWTSIFYPPGTGDAAGAAVASLVDWGAVNYPPGTGSTPCKRKRDIDYTPEGGWSSIDWTSIFYPPGTGAAAGAAANGCPT
jgi:hypothetical protein